MDFLFKVAFRCNGVYDATATATLDQPVPTHDLKLYDINIAIPPQPPRNFLATDNGNRTVTLTWSPPSDAPPDLAGYRLSRKDAGGSSFGALGTATPAVNSYDDANIPAAGGSYVYRIETLRKASVSTNPPLVSAPITTNDVLVVGGASATVPKTSGGSASGGGGGGRGYDQIPGGATHFDPPSTLVADEGEPGHGDLALPGAGTIQRFAGREGAGLIKPFAAALDLAVWAGLLLFLTRRAASAARADALMVEIEQPS
jgi:hypothetical protein